MRSTYVGGIRVRRREFIALAGGGVAADLVSRPVSVLVANDWRWQRWPRPRPFRSCSSVVATPVELGLVASHNRPDGNATGVHGFVTALGPKRLHLLANWCLMPGYGEGRVDT
jgi:hypothetical protein